MNRLTNASGLQLQLRQWPVRVDSADGANNADSTNTARGTVQIVHGLGEHMGRYEGLAVALNAAGWNVVGHDQQGHGRSQGARGALASTNGLLADVAAVMDALRVDHKGAWLLLGHSLGGAVAARFVAEALLPQPAAWSRAVDGLVLSSPALDHGMSPFQRALVTLLVPLLPNLRVGNGLKPEWISRDPAVVQAYVDDPLVHSRVTPRLVRFLLQSGAMVQAHAAWWRVPSLLLWAGADRCVAPAGSATFAAAAPPSVLSAEVFPTLFHEIFNEPERALVINRLTSWLLSQARRF